MSAGQEGNLKKVLGFGDALGFVFGNILGAGVLVMTGIGIGLTGKGVVVAFLLAGIMNCICVVPMVQLASAMPTTGAGYRYSTLLLGPKWGAMWQMGVIFSKVTIALYALSFAQYLQTMYPDVSTKNAALVMITFFFVLNLIGIKSAASTQKILVLLKISGLSVFAIWGISSVDIGSFASMEAIMPKGTDGMLQAIGIVAFASYGGVLVAELGGEMKNPARDLPLSIIIGTIGSTLVYMIIAFVASGTLPVDQVADKPLNLVAKSVLSPIAYYYFMMAGVVIALGTVLNSVFQWVTRGLIISCEDGWLPKKLGIVNQRFGTPHYALTFFFLLGAVTIISDISLVNIARVGFSFLLLVNILPVVGCFYLPKKYPEQYATALFRMSPKVLYTFTALSITFMFGQVLYLLKGLPANLIIALFGLIVCAVVYVNIVARHIDLKKISEGKITFNQ